MGLLSLLQFGQQASPLAALTQPQATPQLGFEWQNRAMLPQAPQIPQGAVAMTPNKQAAQGNGTPPGGWMSRLNDGLNSPLFNVGMALLAGSQNGGDWGVVSDNLRQYGQDRREQQQQDNEDRRLKAQQNMQNTQFGWAQDDRTRASEQRQRYTDWAAGQGAEAAVNPEAAYGAAMEQRAAAASPITPFQQAQLDLQRRGLSIDAMRAQAERDRINAERPLRGPDAALMTSVRESADRSSQLAQLGQMFIQQNGTTGTGPDTQLNPFRGWDSGVQNMNSIVSQMIPYMRAPGSGSTSDYEAQLYQRGVQSPTNSPEANMEIYRNQQSLREVAQQRRFFFEDYAGRYGRLNGAEQAFVASPQFQAIVRANPLPRTNNAPPSTQRGDARSPSTQITPEQARAELERRNRERRQSSAYGQQPGGYTGR